MQSIYNTLIPVSGISHPLVADMYLKKNTKAMNGSKDQDVLVIETRKNTSLNNETEYDSFDSYLIDLLLDLEELKAKAEKKIGTFDRIDIRSS